MSGGNTAARATSQGRQTHPLQPDLWVQTTVCATSVSGGRDIIFVLRGWKGYHICTEGVGSGIFHEWCFQNAAVCRASGTGGEEQECARVLTHRCHVQVPVGGLAARQSGLVGLLPAHVRGIIHGHSLHRQLHQPDIPCCHVCRVSGESSATSQLAIVLDASNSYEL